MLYYFKRSNWAFRLNRTLKERSFVKKKETKQQKLDRLNTEVTSAIFVAENAQSRVSQLEEEIVKITSPHSLEGKIARRGAVYATLAGRGEERARMLVRRFCSEKGVSTALKKELRALLKKK